MTISIYDSLSNQTKKAAAHDKSVSHVGKDNNTAA
ncbi:hypothetical protein IMPR6_690280 [Imperialibacter sp. EC-SDR9]|nr:hypothetical protein IMPERIA89_340280 [Imperialibacter sp. 89]CAD5297478.1 hypothetical protein IMPERIA75_700280 [Imperialibacter sp. 75]VVT34119.1 hypothetical protein IMPR6_690280 [Imperialibacter sp. EC-SDR9]